MNDPLKILLGALGGGLLVAAAASFGREAADAPVAGLEAAPAPPASAVAPRSRVTIGT